MRTALAAAALAIVAAILAAPTGAAPASVSTTQDCHTFFDFRVCGVWRSVGHQTVTPSGNLVWSFRSTADYAITYLPTGEVTETADIRWHDTFVVKDADAAFETHVHHSTTFGHSWSTYSGLTCRSRFTYQFVDGEVRRQLGVTDCS